MIAERSAVRDAELVRRLFVLLKAAGVYAPGNAGYRQHAEPALEALRAVLEADGAARLTAGPDGLRVNGRAAPPEPGVEAAVGYVGAQLERRGVGAVRFDAGADASDLDALVRAFAGAVRGAGREALEESLRGAGARRVTLEAPEAGAESEAAAAEAGPAALARRSFVRAVDAVERVMTGLREGARPSLDAAEAAVAELGRRVLEDEQALFELTLLRDFDEYTYAHSVNVCVYGTAVGARLGLRAAELTELGQACLFHDVGKARLPREVLDKPGELDEAEWAAIRRHPALGARALLGLRLLPGPALTRAALVAFEHHRGFDGKGYPSARRPSRQDVYSRICALADAFDALTSGRVYARRPLTPHEAVLRMARSARTSFDPLLFRVFLNAVGVFPIGTVVELDTGERALVRRNGADPLHPSLLRLDDGRAEELGGRSVRRTLTAGEAGVDAGARLEAFSRAREAPSGEGPPAPALR